MKTIEEIIANRILYIGEEIPESLVKDKRAKFILLGVPADLIKELEKNKSGQDDCNHKFDFGLGGKDVKTSRHCVKCDHWEDVTNEKKS